MTYIQAHRNELAGWLTTTGQGRVYNGSDLGKFLAVGIDMVEWGHGVGGIPTWGENHNVIVIHSAATLSTYFYDCPYVPHVRWVPSLAYPCTCPCTTTVLCN